MKTNSRLTATHHTIPLLSTLTTSVTNMVTRIILVHLWLDGADLMLVGAFKTLQVILNAIQMFSLGTLDSVDCLISQNILSVLGQDCQI